MRKRYSRANFATSAFFLSRENHRGGRTSEFVAARSIFDKACDLLFCIER